MQFIQIIDPAHFVIKECPDLSNESSFATSFLEAEAAMQQYYNSVDPGFIQLPLKDTVRFSFVLFHYTNFHYLLDR